MQMPKYWYNVTADLPFKLEPYFDPVTHEPVAPEKMLAIFPPALLEQEMSATREFAIPPEVSDILSAWRPTPLRRARALEKALGTPAKIYYKYEGVSPAGSHKVNTAIAQVYYNKIAGIKKLTTETGAGQWGCSAAFAAKHFGLDCQVFMVKVSAEQKPYRKSFMRLFGAEVVSSPSTLTNAGKQILSEDPNSTGSLSIAISEAVEVALGDKDTNYVLGSVLNHVLLHQTIIGLEAKEQLEALSEYPDYVIACAGGGSNFGGIAAAFVRDAINGKKVKTAAVEPASCPTLTRGEYAYDYGDSVGIIPIVKMYTLGGRFRPPAIHAGGLRYHGMSPIVSGLVKNGITEALSEQQEDIFKYGVMFAHAEGIVPAPESCHAIAGACRKAIEAKEEGKEKTILFCLSGHGFFDFSAYEDYLSGKLENFDLPQEEINRSLAYLPKM